MKKKSIMLLALLCICNAMYAQVYKPLSWSAIMKDATGNPLATTAVPLKFTFKNDTAAITYYVETQTVTTDDKGLVSVLIGEGVLASGSYDSVKWTNRALALKVEADFGGGYELLSEAQMNAVPYAMHANKADYAQELRSEDLKVKISSGSNELKISTDDNTRIKIASNGKVTINDLANSLMTRNRPVFTTPDGTLIDTPSVHYYSITGSDFVADNGNAAKIGQVSATYPNAASGALLAPIHLPHHARLQSVTLYYTDNSAAGNMTVQLWSTPLDGSSSNIHTTFASSGTSLLLQTNQSTSSSIINNETRAYYIYASSSAWPGDYSLSIKGIVIKYIY